MDVASLIVSLIALGVSLMALPTVFQMFFGAPKLFVFNDRYDAPEGLAYRMHVENASINSELLRKLGVTRSSVEITGDLEVLERNTKKVVDGIRRTKFVSYKENGFQVTVHRSYAPPFLNVIYQSLEGDCYTLEENGDCCHKIIQGEYELKLYISDSTDKNHTFSQIIRIGKNRHDTFFIGNPRKVS